MGLIAALNNSVAGLNINQQHLDVLSQNIANANTPNYSNEVVNQQASFINGQGSGVSVASITRTVSEFLNAEVQSQTSTNGSATAVQGYYTDIENLLGQPGGTNSIDQSIDSFFTALQNMANSPSDEAETNAVNAGNNVAAQISGLASSLYGLQLQSDNDISSAISSINSDLKNLQAVNSGLEQAAATGQSTGGLLDQRDAALGDIAQYIDIKPIYQEDGEVTINTTNGTTLLTPNSISQLSYAGASGVQTFVNNDSLSPIEVTTLNANGTPVGAPAILATGGPAASVTTTLAGGQIQGLLSVRDSVIPHILQQLDGLASNLRDQVNAVTNAGTSFPPPNSYTGTRLVTASATSQYSGNLQIAVLSSSGTPVASPYTDEPNGMPPLTLNLSTLNYGQGDGVLSVNNLVSAINQYYGVPQNKLELGNINNVQLALASNTVPDAGNTINFGFNLNDIASSSTAHNAPASFTVTSANIYIGNTATSASSVPITGTGFSTSVNSGQTLNTTTQTGGTLTASLDESIPGVSTASYFTVVATIQTTDKNGNPVSSTVSYQVPNNASDVANDIVGATSQTGSGTIMVPTTTQPLATATLVDANGNPLIATDGSYGNQQGYLKITANNSTQTIAINELNSTQGSTGQGVSQYFGLNNFFNNNSLTASGDTLVNSAYNLSVASRITNDPSLLSTGTLSQSNQSTNVSDPPNLTYQLSPGDNSISQALAALATKSVSFNPAGGLPTSNTTLAQYAGQIIANTSTNSTNATNAATDSQTLLSGFTSRAQAVSGVNLDQELANTVIYQNAYSASARVISVVDALFTALIGIIQ